MAQWWSCLEVQWAELAQLTALLVFDFSRKEGTMKIVSVHTEALLG